MTSGEWTMGGDEPQGVIAQGQSIPLAHCHLPLRGNRAEKVLDHGEGLGGGDHLRGGIGLQDRSRLPEWSGSIC